MPRDALGAHARGELGISDLTAPRPIRAALASGAAFSVGGILPLALTLATPGAVVVETDWRTGK